MPSPAVVKYKFTPDVQELPKIIPNELNVSIKFIEKIITFTLVSVPKNLAGVKFI